MYLIIPAWLDFDPRVSLPLWVALAAALAIAWCVYAWRCGSSIARPNRLWTLALMLVAGAVPLVLLLNPTWVEALPPPEGRPLVTVVVDTSASMDVIDKDEADETRLQIATKIAEDLLSSFDETYETRLLSFDADARGRELGELGEIAPGQKTDLASAIALAANSDRPRGQAVVFLSDGIHNTGAARRVVAASRAARGRGAPLFPVKVAQPLVVKNLAVETSAANRLAFVEQPVKLTAEVTGAGYQSAPLDVRLMRDGQVVETKTVTLSSDGRQEVSFTAKPEQPGLYRYSIAVGSLPAEATDEDNSASLLVRVVDSPIGVLLLEGKPYWDSKFLARKLASDPSIELESLVMMRSDRFLHRRQRISAPSGEEEAAADADSANEDAGSEAPPWEILPTPESVIGSADSLNKYQVIVLGRDSEAYLDDTTVTRLRTWVSTQGGSLVCARGAPQSTLSEKLGRMLPVRWTRDTERRFRATVTDASSSEGWLARRGDIDPLAALPSLATDASPEKRGGLPRVLVASDATDGSVPIVTYQPYGAGRTVVVEGSGMWRWALLPPEFAASDETYASVWNGLLQWLVSRVALSPGQDRALQSDRTQFTTDMAATATLLVRDTVPVEGMPVVHLVREGDMDSKEIICEPAGDQPGVYQARFGKLAPGNYRVTLKDAAETDRSVTAFEVRRPIAEALDMNPRDDLLASIAKESGGRVIDKLDAGRIAETIQQQIIDDLPIETRRTPAWDRWWVLLGILGMWTATWTLRRRSGLV